MRIRDRLADVVTIVKPETLLAWNRRMKRRKWDYSRRRGKTGLLPKQDATEALVVKLAEDRWTLPAYDRNPFLRVLTPPGRHAKTFATGRDSIRETITPSNSSRLLPRMEFSHHTAAPAATAGCPRRAGHRRAEDRGDAG